jgi:uncharacterized damage-inducible protein DinB
MRRSVLILLAAAAPLAAQQQQSGAPTSTIASLKGVWMVPHSFVVRAVEQTAESLFTFKPTPDVRSLGELFGHVADGEHLICSLALGEPMPQPMDVNEKTKKTKAELLQALKESAAHCDRAYAQSESVLMSPVNFFGNPVNRLWMLSFNGAHDYEHYGNIVTYLRLKGIVPPSSQR